MTKGIDYTAFIEEFKRTGQMPLVWQWTAREFVCAANIVRCKCGDPVSFAPGLATSNNLWKPHSAVRLLFGLALENLLKGLLVAQGIDATSTGKLNKKLQTHDLVHLWTWAGLPIAGQTKNVLRNLHWSIEVGKYPVGTKPDPQAPTPFWVAVTSLPTIADMLQTVEDALRAKQPGRTFDKTNLLELCSDSTAV